MKKLFIILLMTFCFDSYARIGFIWMEADEYKNQRILANDLEGVAKNCHADGKWYKKDENGKLDICNVKFANLEIFFPEIKNINKIIIFYTCEFREFGQDTWFIDPDISVKIKTILKRGSSNGVDIKCDKDPFD